MKTSETNTYADRQYASLLENISFQPIFIMGDHRSGTTLLYQLLEATQCFNVVTSYHVVLYDKILHNYLNHIEHRSKKELSDYFSKMGLTDRIIDGIKVTPDLPEEYGFILGRNSKPKLSPKNLLRFIELCKKIQFVSGQNRPLLLKNPWDFLNFRYIKEAIPESKFIFIHRNPINTINSQLKAIQSLFSTKNQYACLISSWYNQIWEGSFQLYMVRLMFSSQFGLGFRIVRRHVALAINYFLENVRSLVETDYICTRYEDLCEAPRSTIKEILTFLGLLEDSEIDYNSFIQVRQTYLLDEVERNQMSITKRLEPYFAYCGYGFEGALRGRTWGMASKPWT